MATTTFQPYTGNGSNKTFNYSFPTYTASEVVVEVDGVVVDNYTIPGYQTTGTRTVTFDNSTGTLNTNLCESDGAPKNNLEVIVRRDTNVDNAKATFTAGSSLKAEDLTNSVTQILRSLQEEQNTPTTTPRIRDAAITTAKIKDANVTTIKIADGSIVNAKLGAGAVTEDKLANDAVRTNRILDDAVTGAKIAADQINSEHYVNGSIDREHLAADIVDGTKIADDSINSEHYVADSIDSEHYAPGSVDNTALGADAVNGDKIANDSINSEHYVDGSIDEQHIANSAVTSNKIADNAVTNTEILNGAVTDAKLATNSVTRVKIAADAIDSTKLADESVNSEHYVDGSINESHINANSVTTGKILNNAVTTDKIADLNVTRGKLANDAVNEDKLADLAVRTEHIADNSVTAAKIADAVIVTSSEQASHSVSNNTFFTTSASDARYFNISSGDTIKDGQTFPDNDTTIATTAAINDRIIDLVDDVGGFVPIANETSFPNTNPDINNPPGSGTIVSVSTLANSYTSNGSGTFTISNGTVGNSTVTITGAANNTTYSAGYGLLVETTSTLNTYTFHRLVPKATEVTTVAGKATEIGRLGTADAVADMAILGTTDVVADMNTLGTADVVADMNLLATSDVISDMNTLAVTSVINDMDTVAGISSNVTTVAGIHGNVTTVAGIQANVTTVAGIHGNVTTVAGIHGNVTTVANNNSNVTSVANNMANVNNFADRYQIAANNPSTDGGGNALAAGDLYFNTSANELKVYNGSAWQAGVTATGSFALTTGNTFTGDNRYNDNVKALFGTGNDAELFWDGSATRFSAGALLNLRADTHTLTNAANSETMLLCTANSAVELNFDAAKKFETTSAGVLVTGTISSTDSLTITNASPEINLVDSGDNPDYKIRNQDGTFRITDTTNNAGRFVINSDGHIDVIGNLDVGAGLDVTGNITVSGTVDGVDIAALNTTVGNITTDVVSDTSPQLGGTLDTNGNLITFGDSSSASSNRLKFGDGADLSLYHNGGHGYVENKTGDLYVMTSGSGDDLILRANDDIFIQPQAAEAGIEVIGNGAVKLYYDNTLKFQTTADGVYLADGDKLQVGTHNDLEIYHSGNYSKLEDSSSAGLVLRQDNDADIFIQTDADVRIGKIGSAEYYIYAKDDDAVELYYDNNKVFETTANGIIATGNDSTGNILIGDLRLKQTSGDTTYIKWDASHTKLEFMDNVSAMFGDGNDLKIVHGGTDSHIENSTGQLKLASDTVRITNGAVSETQALFTANGSAELFYDNGRQLETRSNGIGLDNNLFLPDQKVFYVGNHLDLQFYHDGSHSYINNDFGHLYIRNHATNSNNIYATLKEGGEFGAFKFGTSEWLFRGTVGGAFEGWYDGNKKFETQSTGIHVTGDVSITGDYLADDNEKLKMGNGFDLQIFHDGANSGIINTTGGLYIRNNGAIHLETNNGESSVKCVANGAAELYYDNTKKFETKSTGAITHGSSAIMELKTTASTGSNFLQFTDNGGNQKGYLGYGSSSNETLYLVQQESANISVYIGSATRWNWDTSGHFVPQTNNQVDIGTSSTRVRNIYTNDLHLSNQGSSNDVDGSWGDWTIQEGESDLFLKNNRSGKKYKFNLTEVS